MAMTDLVTDLVRFLSQDALTVEDVAGFVGPVVDDPGAPLPAELDPVLPGVRAARLARYPDSGTPFVLTIEPDAASPTTPRALRPTLGEFERALTRRETPTQVLFAPSAGARWAVVVIARLASEGGDLDDAPITSIAFRRDPVTP
jgi:hypothetical protein